MATVIRVLVIEDDDDDRLLTQEMLEDIEGTRYDVTWIEAATAGIEALANGEHDVCLLDYRLGAMTGLEVLESASALGSIPPCLILTGQDNAELDRAAAAAGASDYLVKGEFTHTELERAMRYAMGAAANLKSLQESETRFRTVIEAAYDGIVVVNTDGQLIGANPAAHQMFGREPGTMLGTHFEDHLAEQEVDNVVGTVRASRVASRIGSFESVGLKVDGTRFPLEVSISSWETEAGEHWGVIVRDVTEQKRLMQQLADAAYRDRLTGLNNRNYLREQITLAAAAFGSTNAQPSVLLVDLDNFKRINDVDGHEFGDQLLRLVAERLAPCIRADETIARLGGDEFAMLVDAGGDTGRLEGLAERVLATLREPFRIDHRLITVQGSIGIATLDNGELDADDLIRRADMAMYAAKSKGRGCFENFVNELEGDVLERIEFEDDLRAAVAENMIVPYFQPIVDLGTGRTLAFEALARWTHPTRGPVAPVEFIPVAERIGIIGQLDKAVFRAAVQQAAEWQATQPGRGVGISINVSSSELADPTYIDFVDEMLAAYPLVSGSLSIEITESVMVGDPEPVIFMLEQLRERQIKIAMDDFGTGYSSLSYLRELPIDVLKLDRSFVNDCERERGRALAESVAQLSEILRLVTVAEGIETEDQRQLLGYLGFARGQGYLFAHPMPASEVLDHLGASELLPRR